MKKKHIPEYIMFLDDAAAAHCAMTVDVMSLLTLRVVTGRNSCCHLNIVYLCHGTE